MKILGFDIGSHSIKVVELEISFGRVELSNYFIEIIESPPLSEVHKNQAPTQEETPSSKTEKKEEKGFARQLLTAEQLKTLRKILSEKKFNFERVIFNFPNAWITNRIYQIPSKDKKTIQNSLGFELEDDIPFSLDDVIYDFATLNTEGSQSTIFSSVALKADIATLLSELQGVGIDPDMISIEPWGLGFLLEKSIPKEYEDRPICVVNMGSKQTSIHMMVGDNPIMTHISSYGGSDITKAIAQSYNLSFDQAEKAKINGAFLLTQTHLNESKELISSEQKEFSETIASALTPIVREIKQTLMAYKTHHKLTPKAVLITGGTSLISNIQLFLEEQLKLPVFQFHYMSKVVGQTLQISESSEAQISVATGLALSIIKPDRNHSINFRKFEFAKDSHLGGFSFETLKRPLKYIGASLAFVYINLIAQGIILNKRATNQEEQLEYSIKSVVGAINESVMDTYKNSPSTLKSAINKEMLKYKNVQVAPPKPQVSAFELLNKISSITPRDITLDVSLFQIKDGQLKISGIVDQNSQVDKFSNQLADVKLLSEINKNKIEEDQKNKKTKFEINAKILEVENVKTK